MTLTAAQQQAISAHGNVLVVAGAGTGKTRTLVERCLACLLTQEPPVSIDEILMVTFTESAAAEMRTRIRERLEHESKAHRTTAHWQEQLALFETAHFGTLHSFCFQLIRQHFYQLALDPQVAVLPDEEARLLAEETLDTLFREQYEGRGVIAKAVQRLIQIQGRGWDRPIRSLVLRLHRYAQTLPSPGAWLNSQMELFAAAEPSIWRRWWIDSVAELPKQWLPTLDRLVAANEVAAQCAAALRKIPLASPDSLASLFAQIAAARSNCRRGKKSLWADPLDNFFAETEFLSSLIGVAGRADPLAEDWGWIREQMTTLLQLCHEFGQKYNDLKRELGVVDFQDLEQYSLRLLWDPATNKPTEIARDWQRKLRFIFVDEYQDINAAQDRIIQCLAREGAAANRFFVGDVKQSIYRFRLANPRIFQGYADQWARGKGQVLPLVDNFRSRESLLNFVNSVFSLLMTRDLGGIDYAAEAALRFGAAKERETLSTLSDPGPAVQLHLLLKGDADESVESEETSEALAEIIDLQEADREARLVGLRLLELHAQRFPIWDLGEQRFRPVDWKDMAILLRSPARKAESYAKEFARLNLPLQVARTGFYQSVEVSDLLSLLQLLDNPLQDLPLLAVLHSPLVGLTANELAEIRLASLKTRFWTALIRWHRDEAGGRYDTDDPVENQSGPKTQTGERYPLGTYEKVSAFLERFRRWRRLARQTSLSGCVETVLAETHYASWVLTQSRGAQRQANIQRLISLAQDFDRFQRKGLFRFLRFVDAQKSIDADPEATTAISENAVRLMSIHQSKGLEFPVVVVADLGKLFNLADLRSEVILDEQFGLCPHVKPPHTGKRYPSLSQWLARRRQLRELLAEELRLLYVAMTRARDRLVLTGAVTERNLNTQWQQPRQLNLDALLAARNYLHWLGLWFSLNRGNEPKDKIGQTALLRWSVHGLADLIGTDAETEGVEAAPPEPIDFASKDWGEVRRRLAWQNPFSAATKLPAKTSVSLLRRQATLPDDEAAVFVSRRNQSLSGKSLISPQPRLSAADVGSAHHEFLQQLSLDRVESADALAQEARRLQVESRLTPEQVAVLDFEGLAYFWQGELGRRIRAQPGFVQRELAFTARFTPAELAGMLGLEQDAGLDDEFILVQGVADLVVLAPKEILLVDFKTDQIESDELTLRVESYAPQLNLYASALSRIYLRPVTEAWLYFMTLRKAVQWMPATHA